MIRIKICCAAALGLLVVVESASRAGDLTPPAGPVAPTMKALDEVEPRIIVNQLPGDAISTHVISQPGSYYLTGNITGEIGKNGIMISADGVSLDLGGFYVTGVVGARCGVTTASNILGFEPDIRIYNGFVENWPLHGIALPIGTTSVDRVSARNNGNHGVYITNGSATRSVAKNNGNHGFYLTDATASQCVAVSNTMDGFHVVEFASISDSMARNNGESGFYLNSAATARGCVSRSNGEQGFEVYASSVVTDCMASLNNMNGFLLDEGCIARGCSARQKSNHGFLAQAFGGGSGLPVVIDACNASKNSQNGFDTITGSVVSRSTSTANTGSGFRFGGGCTISDCSASSNGGIGFDSEGGGSTVRDSAAFSNTGAGFESFNSNLFDSIASQNNVGIRSAGGIVRGCTALFSTLEGINDVGGTRIEGNHAEFIGTTGILVPNFSQSIVIGNDATGNSPNFFIGGGNSRGNIINHTGGGVLNSGEPRENVEH